LDAAFLVPLAPDRLLAGLQNGELYEVTPAGAMLRAQELKQYQGKIGPAFAGPEGTIWVALDRGQIARIDGADLQVETATAGSAPILEPSSIFAAHSETYGPLIGLATRGSTSFLRREANQWQWWQDLHVPNQVRSLIEHQGGLIFGTADADLQSLVPERSNPT